MSAGLLYASTSYSAAQLDPTFYPLRFPPLPLLPAFAILLPLIAGFAAPPPERPYRSAPGESHLADPATADVKAQVPA